MIGTRQNFSSIGGQEPILLSFGPYVHYRVCSPKIGLGVFPRSDYNKIWQGYSGG